jgi:hypothetical protein
MVRTPQNENVNEMPRQPKLRELQILKEKAVKNINFPTSQKVEVSFSTTLLRHFLFKKKLRADSYGISLF